MSRGAPEHRSLRGGIVFNSHKKRASFPALAPLLLGLLVGMAALACQAAYQVVDLGSGPTPFPTPSPVIQEISPSATFTLSPASSPSATLAPTLSDFLATAGPNTLLSPTSTLTPTALPLAFQQDLFDQVWQTVKDNYLYPDYNGLDWAAVKTEYLQKIAAGLTNAQFYSMVDEMIFRLNDDHSVFLSPEQNIQQEAETQGKFDYVGVGVLLSAVPARQRAVIILTYPGSPAEAAGLRSRDSVITVDGQSILEADGRLKTILLGPEGTAVSLTVQTPGQPERQLTLDRKRISLEPVIPHQVLASSSGRRIGYVLLPSFDQDNIGLTFQAALDDMSSEAPLDGLVIDDRQNPGGMDSELSRTLSLFTGGTLGHFVSREEERPFRVLKARDIKGSLTYPLVVLVGRGTFSFGEIFAGILQDTGRAYIIGETTEGNVETLWNYDFEDGSRLWLAHEYFRPLNHPDQKWEGAGIAPDLAVPVEWDEYTVETDPAVKAALNYIDTKK